MKPSWDLIRQLLLELTFYALLFNFFLFTHAIIIIIGVIVYTLKIIILCLIFTHATIISSHYLITRVIVYMDRQTISSTFNEAVLWN